MNTVVYKSRIDWWLWIPLFALILWSFVTCIRIPLGWISILASLFPTLLVFNCFFCTKYVIDEDAGKLIVKCGILFYEKYDISKITSLEPTKSPVSAPALSVSHRLAVKSGNKTLVVISPADIPAFTSHLHRLNPTISLSD